MLTPRAFMAASIKTHEGGLSLHPNDNGNWYDPARYAARLPQKRGMGKLVGSKFGVTAYAYADYTGDKNVEAWEIAAITFELAVDIAEHIYIKAPRFNLLLPSRVVLSVIDKGWLSGPGTAAKLVQRTIGVLQDGKIGPATAAAYAAWHAKLGEAEAARAWAKVRTAHETAIATNDGPKDKDLVFLKGWTNRTNSFVPGTAWWKATA